MCESYKYDLKGIIVVGVRDLRSDFGMAVFVTGEIR